jgi:hypothetical protein
MEASFSLVHMLPLYGTMLVRRTMHRCMQVYSQWEPTSQEAAANLLINYERTNFRSVIIRDFQ